MKLPTWLWGGRPSRWFRFASAAMALLFAVGVLNAQELTDALWGLLACSLMLLNAIAPKGLYDGRFNAWTKKHPVVSGSLIFLVLGAATSFLLSDYLDRWLAAVIVFPLSAAFAAWIAYRERATSRKT